MIDVSYPTIESGTHGGIINNLLFVMLSSHCSIERERWCYLYYIPGLLGVFCRVLLECLSRLPGDGRTMVGFMTYDQHLHFYNLKVF